MSKRDDYQKMMDENLALWGARLTTLRGRLAGTPAAAVVADQTRLAEWEARYAAVVVKLEALKASTSDTWDELKLGVAREWHDLDTILALGEQALRASDSAAATSSSPLEAVSPSSSTSPAAPSPG
jgi:hypothetical protein